MPVEIGQLVFRAKVEMERPADAPAAPERALELRQLVELCVEQVLEILRREKER